MTKSDLCFSRRVVITIVLVGLALLSWYTATLLLLAFAGVMGDVVVSTGAEGLRNNTRLSRRSSYLVLFGGLGLASVTAWLLMPRVATQLGDLRRALPNALGNNQEYLNKYEWGRAITARLGSVNFGVIAGKIASVVTAVINVAVAVTVTIVLTASLGRSRPL